MDIVTKVQETLGIDEVLKLIKVVSPYGQRHKSALRSYGLQEKELLLSDLNRLDLFVHKMKREPQFFSKLRQELSHIKNIDESLENAHDGLALSQVELYEFKLLSLIVKRIDVSYGGFFNNLPEWMMIQLPRETMKALDPDEEGLETFYIADHYSEDLSGVRCRIQEVETSLKAMKLDLLKVVLTDYPKVKGRPNGTLVLRKSDQDVYARLLKDSRVYMSDEHFDTVAFSMRATEAMTTRQHQLDNLKIEEEKAIYAIRLKLSQIIASEGKKIQHSLAALGWLDFYVAKAALAIGVNGSRPLFVQSGEGIEIINGRHIGLEQRLRKANKAYTPVTVRFDTPVALITGANMGGKTIALKMIGQVVAMAHYGLYVCADQLKTPMLSFIDAVIGDEQSIDMGLSTFGSEVLHLKKAINQAQTEGLILIDELARGTNPQEGAALSKSIVDYLSQCPAYSVITTHFDAIVSEGTRGVTHWQVKGLKDVDISTIASKGEDLLSDLTRMMDYRLERVEANVLVPKEAIQIAELMGLPQNLIDDARQHLKNRERNG
jgi:DNA mismatch repair protein MutS2